MTKLKNDAKNFATLFKAHHKKHSKDINSMWSCIKKNLHVRLYYNTSHLFLERAHG